MKRPLSLLTVVLIAGCAPVPKDRPNLAYYFPTQVGDSWVYDVDGHEVGYTVRKVEEKDGGEVVTVSMVGIGGAFTPDTTNTFLVSPNGLFTLTTGYSQFDPPLCGLKLPHVDGAKWEETDPRPALDWLKYKRSSHGPEKVTVPAGTFQAIRVEVESAQREGPPLRVTIWYAPGVGEIKRVQAGSTTVMKSFTSGKG